METLLRGLHGSNFVPYFSCPAKGPMFELVKSLHIPIEIHELYQPNFMHPFETLRHWYRWLKFIIAHNLTLLHANDLHSSRSALLAAYACRVPIICHVRFPLDNSYYHWVFRRLPKPFGFIFVSQAIHKEVGPILSKECPNSKQWIVYNGVDISRFKPANSFSPIPRIGIIANLQFIKGHEDFLDMAVLLKKRGKIAQYDIIGGDIQNQGRLAVLKAYAKQRGLLDDVYFHGHVSNIAVLIRQMDIIVCASHIEPFGRCLIEGMACAKPIVATRVGGIPEVVDDQKTGFLVPPKSPNDLAEAVEKLIDDKHMRIYMGEQGRLRAEKFFSMDSYTQKIIKIYYEILNS